MEVLEEQIRILVRGVEMLHCLLESGQKLPEGPLHTSKNGTPCVNDILDRAGVLPTDDGVGTTSLDMNLLRRLVEDTGSSLTPDEFSGGLSTAPGNYASTSSIEPGFMPPTYHAYNNTYASARNEITMQDFLGPGEYTHGTS